MKILIVTQYFWPENFKINDFALGMHQRGHEVTIFTGKPNYPSGEFYHGYNFFNKRIDEYQGIKIIRVPLISRGNGKGIRLFINYLSFALFGSISAFFRIRGNFDVIFVHEPSPITVGLPAIVLKKKFKVPMFFWVMDLWPESVFAAGNIKNSFITKCLKKLVEFIYKNSDKIFITSHNFAESIEEKKVNKEKIIYFPNWAEEFYMNRPINPNQYIHIIPVGFKIMFAGNIGVSQDFESILSAAELLRTKVDIHWIILGDGRKKQWLMDEIKVRKLENNFHLLGSFPPEEMPNFFCHADSLLVTLKNAEIFGLTVPAKIQSYLAFGKPILAMLNGEGAAIINESEAGFACSAGNYQQLAENIIQLHNFQDVQLKIMSNKAKDYYNKNFNRNLLFDRFEDIYHFYIQNELNNHKI